MRRTYKLLKWYPSLMDEFLVGMTVTKEKDEYEIYLGETTKGTLMEGKNTVEKYPEFWQEIKINTQLNVKKMKQTIYYSDARSAEFSIEEYTYRGNVENDSLGELILIKGHNGISSLFFDSPEQVNEFCELLQEKKKEIWQEK